MTIRYAVGAASFMSLAIACLSVAAAARAAPLVHGAGAAASGTSNPVRVDTRPYYHCHGPKRCHGKGNYYKYTPSQSYEPFKYGCVYGCGFNNGWNSPSSRYDYIGRRHHHRHRRHRH